VRAIQCVAYGDPEALVPSDIEEPVAGVADVVVAVEAVGLGYVDALYVRGAYQVKRPLPFVPGSEVAGRVVALGGDADPSLLGRRVMALSPNGALVERIALPARSCTPLPEAVDPAVAAGMLVNYSTALYGLDMCGALRAGETILVLGAAGAVGDAALDVARAMGARTIAAASSPEKLAACRARGADLAIDYSKPDWRKALEVANAGHRIDMIYDPVGGTYSETAFRCLSPGGRHLVVGFATGEIPRLPLNLPLLKRSSIVGVDWGGYVRADPAGDANAPILARLLTWLADGRIDPRPQVTMHLDQAPAILRRLLDRQSIGKPVVRL